MQISDVSRSHVFFLRHYTNPPWYFTSFFHATSKLFAVISRLQHCLYSQPASAIILPGFGASVISGEVSANGRPGTLRNTCLLCSEWQGQVARKGWPDGRRKSEMYGPLLSQASQDKWETSSCRENLKIRGLTTVYFFRWEFYALRFVILFL